MTVTSNVTEYLTVDIIGNGILSLAALGSFIYSLVRFFKPRGALYKKMVGCALGCIFLERIYSIVQFIVAGELTEIFQIGSFGNIGCFMFLFSANYGAFNSLIDDRSETLKKYRRIALAAPVFFIAAGVVILLSPANLGRSISCFIEEVLMGLSCYYSLKFLIIPKEYADITTSLRPFHLLSLGLALIFTVENILWVYDPEGSQYWIIIYIVSFLFIVALAPVLHRGIKKWKA